MITTLPAQEGDMTIWRSNLGTVLHDLGDLTSARTQYERALQISEAALGSDHAQTQVIRRNLDALPIQRNRPSSGRSS
jgi:hypothetical protein